MSKLDNAVLRHDENPYGDALKGTITDRNARAARLVAEHDAVQKKIIDFIQEDPQVKEQGWQGSPYSYLQYILAKWAVDRLK